ncbi:MAG TPA: NAD(P)H-binding protein [Propionicimonas sp.]|nr:NAD(P)H-binding protein [Propionicimonas sp.]
MTEIVAVAGATGYLGRHVCVALAEAGFAVRALVRSQEAARKQGNFEAPSLADIATEWSLVDYQRPETLQGVFDGADRVVSTLGVTRQKTSPWDIDFLGNLRLLEQAEASGVRSFCYANVIRSDSGTSLTMRSKHAFSQVLQRSSVAGQIVNPSGYFSDMTDLLMMARKGIGLVVGDGQGHVNPIHGADLAAFMVSKLTGPAGEWDVGGPDIFTYQELTELAFDIAGRRGRVIHLGPGTTRAMIGIADHASLQASNLARFFLEGFQLDATGTCYGTRHLADYWRTLQA